MNRFHHSLIAIVTLIINVCGFSSTTFASTSPTTYQQAIQFVKERGIMTGSEDGAFHPEATLTRCELIKIAVLMTNVPAVDDSQLLIQQFSDLPADGWCAQYVKIAQKRGVINGYPDGTFKPNRKVSQIEALKILFNAPGLILKFPTQADILPYADVKPSDWWAGYIQYGLEHNIIPAHSGSNYGIQNEIRRDDTAVILWKILKPFSTSAVYGDAIGLQTFPILEHQMNVIHYCSGTTVMYYFNAGLKSCLGKNTLAIEDSDGSSYVIDSLDTTNNDMGPVLLKIQSETQRQNPFLLISYVPRYFAPNYYEASPERDEHMNYKMDPTYVNFFVDILSKQSKRIANYPDGAQYIDQGKITTTGANQVNVHPHDSLAVYWSNTALKAVFIPTTCEMMGCIAAPLMGYDIETDQVRPITEERAMGKTLNPDEFSGTTPYWANVKNLSNNQWSAELISADGHRRSITFTF